MAFDIETAFDHGLDHLRPETLVMVCRRYRKIAFLIARAITEVLVFAAGIPSALFGIDEIKAGMGILVEADIVKNEKFSLSAEICRIACTAVFEKQLGFFGDPTGIALVVLLRDGIPHVACHHKRRHFRERIHEGCIGIGNEKHIALVDGSPASDTRSIDTKAVLKRIDGQFTYRIRNVMLQAGYVAEAHIQLAGTILFGKIQYLLRGHSSSIVGITATWLFRQRESYQNANIPSGWQL